MEKAFLHKVKRQRQPTSREGPYSSGRSPKVCGCIQHVRPSELNVSGVLRTLVASIFWKQMPKLSHSARKPGSALLFP